MPNHVSGEHTELITVLNGILADTAVVYYKTHGFHWNVEGPNFYGLHLMFEKFYITLWESLDEIAERIRTLKGKAPPSYMELLKNASIKETEVAPLSSLMVQMLRDDYLLLAKKAREAASFSEGKKDPITANIMLENATFLEKAAWMLHSSSMS